MRTEGLDVLCAAAVRGTADTYGVCVARSYRVCARTFVLPFACDAQDAVGTCNDANAYLDLGAHSACARAQILVGRALRHAPALAEDDFRHLPEAYRLPLKDFRALTGEGVRIFSYLRATRTRGRLPPARPLEEATLDPRVPEPVRETERRSLDRVFVEVGDLLVARRRREVVSTRASGSAVTMRELWDALGHSFRSTASHATTISGSGASTPLTGSWRGDCPDVMRVSRAADARCGGSVRYYDPKGRDFPAIEGAGYGDLTCSSALLMRDLRLRGAIEALDVRNGYELHHVLARYRGPIDVLRVGKSPSLFFGEGDHESQVRALVTEVGPVAGPELSREYERRYGTRAGSFTANMLPHLVDLLRDGLYGVSGHDDSELAVLNGGGTTARSDIYLATPTRKSGVRRCPALDHPFADLQRQKQSVTPSFCLCSCRVEPRCDRLREVMHYVGGKWYLHMRRTEPRRWAHGG